MNFIQTVLAFLAALLLKDAGYQLWTRIPVGFDWRGWLSWAGTKAKPVANYGAMGLGYLMLGVLLLRASQGCTLPPLPPIPWPVPPGPTPTPVPPADPFLLTLQATYGSDVSPTKAQDKTALAAVYRRGVDLAKKPEIATAGALLTAMRQDANAAIEDRLMSMRGVIATELDKHLPRVPAAPLDQATRDTIAAQFDRMAKLLEGIN